MLGGGKTASIDGEVFARDGVEARKCQGVAFLTPCCVSQRISFYQRQRTLRGLARET